MGRRRGFDKGKISRIVSVLYSHQDGVWIRQIARETSMHHNTVTKYVDTVMKPLVEDVSLGRQSKPMLRVIRLKPLVVQKLQEGRSLDQILRLLEIIKENE